MQWKISYAFHASPSKIADPILASSTQNFCITKSLMYITDDKTLETLVIVDRWGVKRKVKHRMETNEYTDFTIQSWWGYIYIYIYIYVYLSK